MTLPIADTPLDARLTVPEPRAGQWNDALTAALVPAPGADAIVARLRAPGALVVTTGQQPGLFTGPSYAISKALSARALAMALERRWQRPVIPVYWVPGDDHDFDEAATVAWLSGDGDLHRVSLAPRLPDAPLVPMYQQPIGPEVTAALDEFAGSLPAAPSRDDTVAWLARHYRPGATVAAAFAGAMAEVLAPLGIVCLDSTHVAVKTAAAPLFLRALERAEPIDRALAARAAELGREGVDAGVPVGDGATLLFLEGPLGRDRVVTQGAGFQTRRGRAPLDRAELARIAREEPTRLSANVLLRPVLESFLLPTVAYVGGPGELTYLRLAEVIYRELDVVRQQPVPRWSGLVVEPRVTRILPKFSATLADLLEPGGALEARLVRASLPEGTEAAFQRLREVISEAYPKVVTSATAVDPTLERPAAAARARALHEADKLEKKVLQHARKREGVELSQVARARLSLRPDGKPQERVLTFPGFMARYGWELLESVARHIEVWYGAALEAASRTP